MPKASRFIKPKFLSCEDVREFGPDGKITTIAGARTARINGEERLVIYFTDMRRAYACNQSNLEALIEMHGGDDDTVHWEGTQVRVFVDESVLFNDQQVGGIIIEAAPEEPKKRLFGGV